MKRCVLLSVVLAACVALVPRPADGQQQELAYIRESLYTLNFGDMLEWNEAYLEHVQPILQEMTEAGIIEGFAAWQHDTGGVYNWRFAMRFFDFESIESAGAEFQRRMQEAVPADVMQKLQTMMAAHEDRIWATQEVNVSEDAGPVNYMYAAEFFVNPARLGEWSAMYEELWKPALAQAVEDGLLVGWVTLGHAHGGPGNWKLLLMHDSWDDMDDVWQRTMSSFGEQLEATFGMVESHSDDIWVPVRPEEG